MADRSKLKIADQNNIDQDDPFAELTKIMGFDPRVPVKRSEAEALQKLSAPAPVVDDFDIDLERELLGEFALDDDATATQAAAPRLAGAPAIVPQRNESQHRTEAQPLAVADDEETDVAETVDIAAFEPADFDLEIEEFEAAASDRPSGDVQARADQDGPSAGAGDDMDLATEAEDAAEIELADHEADFDAAFVRTMNDEFDDDWEPDTDVAEAEAAAPVRVAAPRVDLDSTFDAAMAEVDMDFDAVERPQGRSGDEPAAVETADGEFAEDDEFTLAADADEPATGDLPGHVETSLEDELAALLGSSAKSQPAVARAGETAEPASDEAAFDDFDWELDAQAEDGGAADVVAAGELEEKLDDAEDRQPQHQYRAVAETDERDWQIDLEPTASEEADASDEAPAFDEEAFAATFADGMDDLLPEEDTTRFEDEPVAHTVAIEAAPARKAEEPDPFEALRRMAGSWRSTQAYAAPAQGRHAAEPVAASRPEPAPAAAYEAEDDLEDAVAQAAVYDDVPEIETVDVPESAVALADDLDLPELAFEEDEPQSNYDDLDAEFASLLSEMNSPEPAPAAPQPTARDAWLDRGRERAAVAPSYAYPAAAAAAPAAYASAAPAQPVGRAADIDLGELDLNFDDQAFDQAFASADDQDMFAEIPDYDPDLDDEMSVPAVPPVAEAPSRRGFWIAALVGGVAIAGGVGAFALSFGDGAGTDTPALVKADSSPIKVRPENPGGTVVPNQDNKVYESVANAKAPAAAEPPKQEKLVTTTEEPVDVAVAEAPEPPAGFSAEEEGAAPPMAKGEDRIEQVIGEAEAPAGAEDVPAVQPRKVRTMIVKPDGSLVPAEMPEPAAETAMGTDAQPLEPAKPAEPAVANAPEATGTVPPAEAAPAPAEAAPVAEVPAKPRGNTQSSSTPNQVAIAPARPADQPLDIVGEVKPDQVAAIDTQPTATAVTAGAWSMQIASQPSQEAAQSTYQDLARRYGGVLSGRSVNIVKAEIPGKGTFWRVRVPAQSRNDAVNLCNSYKSAGGNCFVSK